MSCLNERRATYTGLNSLLLKDTPPNILVDVLDNLEFILTFGDVCKDPKGKNSFTEDIKSNKEWRYRLKDLQSHQSREVKDSADKIVLTFFKVDK